jgi:hypothetical protein
MADPGSASNGSPPREFWEDDLEMSIEHVLAEADSDEFMGNWLDKRTGPQVRMLRHLIHLAPDVSVQAGRTELQERLDDLRRFVPCAQFAKNKLTQAIIDFALLRISAGTSALAEVGDSYDAVALLLAVYHRNWRDPALVFHLEKVYRKGAARMVLRHRHPHPASSLGQFLTPEIIEGLLAVGDRAIDDGRRSQFKSQVVHDGIDLIFVRRAEKPDLLLQGQQIIHGHRPEWIILGFRDGAERVNISSESKRPSLELANAIATGYFGKDCDYINEQLAAHDRQLQRLLEQLKADNAEGLTLVEVRVRNAPLDDAPKLDLSAEQADSSIAPAVRQFEGLFGPILEDLSNISSIKVRYRGKRVRLIFDDSGDDEEPPVEADAEAAGLSFVLRYTDHVLAVAERRQFELLMEEVHGIPVVSTEKRFRA